MAWTKPTTDGVRDALRAQAPTLAEQPVRFLAEGWECWAFEVGDHVLRFPRPRVDLHRLPEGTTNLDSLRLERAVLPALAAHLTVAVPHIDVYAEDGPNGAPFAGHRLLPGEPVLTASRTPGPDFGRAYGTLLRELQPFPVAQAVDLGVPYVDGAVMQAQRGRHYEQVIRRVFPLISCEARTHIERLRDVSQQSGALRVPAIAGAPGPGHELPHRCRDRRVVRRHRLRRPGGRKPCVGLLAAAVRVSLPRYPGAASSLPRGGGHRCRHPGRMRPEVDFIDLNFPLTDILSGLDREDELQVAEGIQSLNAAVPFGLRCD